LLGVWLVHIVNINHAVMLIQAFFVLLIPTKDSRMRTRDLCAQYLKIDPRHPLADVAENLIGDRADLVRPFYSRENIITIST
jgi:hypothetical protein